MADWNEGGSLWASMQMEEALDTYCNFQAMRLHFQGRYDWHKYGDTVKIKLETFLKRRDKKLFLQLHRRFANREDGIFLAHLAANFIANPKIWVTGLLNPNADAVRKQWIASVDAYDYNFQCFINDSLRSICMQNNKTFLELIRPPEDGQHPWLLKAVVADRIPMEVVIGLDRCTGFISTYDKHFDDPIWTEVSEYLHMIQGFYMFDYKPSQIYLINFIRKHGL